MKKVTTITKADRKALGISKDQCSNLQRLRDVMYDTRFECLTAKQFTALQELSDDELIEFTITSPKHTMRESVDIRLTEDGYAVAHGLIELKLWPAALPAPDRTDDDADDADDDGE